MADTVSIYKAIADFSSLKAAQAEAVAGYGKIAAAAKAAAVESDAAMASVKAGSASAAVTAGSGGSSGVSASIAAMLAKSQAQTAAVLAAQQASQSGGGGFAAPSVSDAAETTSVAFKSGDTAAKSLKTSVGDLSTAFPTLAANATLAERSLSGAAAAERDLNAAGGETTGVLSKVGVGTKGLIQDFQGLNSDAESLWRNLDYGRLAAGGLGIAFVTLGLAVAHVGVQYDQEREQEQAAFDSLIKNTTQANKVFSELEDTARQTNVFTPNQLEDSARQLINSGVAASKVIQGEGATAKGVIIDVANAAAAQGPKAASALQQITRVLGQMVSTGTVSTYTVRSLTRAGVDATQILHNQLGLTTADIKNLSKAGVSSQDVFNALAKGISEQYGGALEREGKTQTATIAGLKEDVEAGLGDAWKSVYASVTTTLSGITSKVSEFDNLIEKEGYMGALQTEFPLVAAGVKSLEGAFDSLFSILRAVEPYVKTVFVTLGGVALGTAVVGLHLIALAFTGIADAVKSIPAPLVTTLGIVTALVIAYTKFQDIATTSKLATGIKSTIAWLKSEQVQTEASAAATAKSATANQALRDAELDVATTSNRLERQQLDLSKAAGAVVSSTGDATLAMNNYERAQIAVTVTGDALQTNLARTDVAMKAVATSNAELAASSGGLKGALSSLTAWVGELNPATIGVAALAGGILAFNLANQSAEKSQYNLVTSGDAVATTLGLQTSQYGKLTTAVEKAAATQAKFNAANLSGTSQLSSQNAATQQANIIQTLVEFKDEGVGNAGLKRYLEAEKAALGPDYKITIPVATLIDDASTTRSLKSWTTLVDNALKGVSSQSGSGLGSLKQIFTNPLAAIGGGSAQGDITGGAQGQLNSLADETSKLFGNNNADKAIKQIIDFSTALKGSKDTLSQQVTALNSYIDTIEKVKSGTASFSNVSLTDLQYQLDKAKTPAQALTDVLTSLGAKGSSTAIQLDGMNLKTLVSEMEKNVAADNDNISVSAKWEKALEAVTGKLKSTASAADNLSAATATMSERFSSGSTQADSFFTGFVSSVQKAFSTFDDLTTSYGDAVTAIQDQTTAAAANIAATASAAQTQAQDLLTAQQDAQEGYISDMRRRQQAQIMQLGASGQATAANLATLATVYTAQDQSADGALSNIIAKQVALKAATEDTTAATQAQAATVVPTLAQLGAQMADTTSKALAYQTNLEKTDQAVGGLLKNAGVTTAQFNAAITSLPGGSTLVGQIAAGGLSQADQTGLAQMITSIQADYGINTTLGGKSDAKSLNNVGSVLSLASASAGQTQGQFASQYNGQINPATGQPYNISTPSKAQADQPVSYQQMAQLLSQQGVSLGANGTSGNDVATAIKNASGIASPTEIAAASSALATSKSTASMDKTFTTAQKKNTYDLFFPIISSAGLAVTAATTAKGGLGTKAGDVLGAGLGALLGTPAGAAKPKPSGNASSGTTGGSTSHVTSSTTNLNGPITVATPDPDATIAVIKAHSQARNFTS